MKGLVILTIHPNLRELKENIYGQEINLIDLSGNRTLINFDVGEEIKVKSGQSGIRFALIAENQSKNPLRAWSYSNE